MNTLASSQKKFDWILIGTLLLLFCGYILFHDLFGGTLLVYNDYDAYTLQALAWRDGQTALSQNYTWLELAVFNGSYYVSFPPVPSLVMLPLTFIFNADVPSNFVAMAYALSSIAFAYRCFRKIGTRDIYAMFWALFFVMGSNMLWMSTEGGSWFLAQGLNLTLCFGAIWSLLCGKKALCLILLAFAVGCRPFSICLLFAVFLYICIEEWKKSPVRKAGLILSQFKYLIVPVIIGICYCLYNYSRFLNPFEFGHNYLPEFSAPGSAQFGLRYFLTNTFNIFLRPVTLNGDLALNFPQFDGFMFFIANPIFLVWFVLLVRDVIVKRMTREQLLFSLALAANLILLLVHKTFGGWQFGARYTVDLLPCVLLYFLLGKKENPRKWEVFLGIFAILFNLYGAFFMQMQ